MNQGLYKDIVLSLETAGQGTPYAADANEPDPRYLGYGVRAPQMKTLIASYRTQFNALSVAEKVALARRLIESGFGEQQTVALHLLDQVADYFTPARFDVLDSLVRRLHGWSKIDTCTGSLLRFVLAAHPAELLALVEQWNGDEELWLRRASVVLFTRRVARSGSHTETALALCENLKHDPEDMVRKGVGWCLKDLMRADKARVLDYVIGLRRQKVSATITLYALRDISGPERESVLAAR